VGTAGSVWHAGVDGCRAGWVAAFVCVDGGETRVRVVPRFADVLAAPEEPAVTAVDIPIGLPQRLGPGGRGPERAVRPLLGARQSSVFSVPSRGAVSAPDYRQACRIALETSDPPRKVSRQLFAIAPKIREVDALLRADASLGKRVCETHPEVAFWRLNGERALSEPKKIKGTPYGPGLALRRDLLRGAGVPAAALDAAAPRRRGRSARCARLRGDGAAGRCGAGPAVPRSARAR
jgi:predicted RNase H-like nuclease